MHPTVECMKVLAEFLWLRK